MEEAEDGYDKNEEAGHRSLLRNPGTLPASRSALARPPDFESGASASSATPARSYENIRVLA